MNIEELYKRFINGESLRQLVKETNWIDYRALLNCFKKNGFEIPDTKHFRKKQTNTKYFKEINTEHKA